MTSITRSKRLNRKLCASIACGMLVCCLSLLLIIEVNFKKEKKMESVVKSKNLQACYQHTSTSHRNEYEIKYLKDVMDADPKPNTGQSIVFHETTCSRSGLLHLNSRYCG